MPSEEVKIKVEIEPVLNVLKQYTTKMKKERAENAADMLVVCLKNMSDEDVAKIVTQLVVNIDDMQTQAKQASEKKP